MYKTIMSYPEYRIPRVWKDGCSGHACISYKGMASYGFGRDDPRTSAFLALKDGGSHTFDDEFWGTKRLMTFTRVNDQKWTCTATTDLESNQPKKTTQDLFIGDAVKNFINSLKEAMNNSYYEDDIEVIMTCSSHKLENNRNSETGTVTVYLEEKYYEELKAYYQAFQSLAYDDYCRGAYMKFYKGWEYLSEVKLRNATWKYLSMHDDKTNYLKPKSMNFKGRCQCEKCIKSKGFQNAEAIRAQEHGDIDILIKHIESTPEPEKFIICLPRNYYEYFCKNVKTKPVFIYREDSSDWSEFRKDPKFRIMLCSPSVYIFGSIPSMWDLYLEFPFTAFLLHWEDGRRRHREYIDEKTEEYMKDNPVFHDTTILKMKKKYASITTDLVGHRGLTLEDIPRLGHGVKN